MEDTKRWTITVEEDTETGEIVLPLPQELLDIQYMLEVNMKQKCLKNLAILYMKHMIKEFL